MRLTKYSKLCAYNMMLTSYSLNFFMLFLYILWELSHYYQRHLICGQWQNTSEYIFFFLLPYLSNITVHSYTVNRFGQIRCDVPHSPWTWRSLFMLSVCQCFIDMSYITNRLKTNRKNTGNKLQDGVERVKPNTSRAVWQACLQKWLKEIQKWFNVMFTGNPCHFLVSFKKLTSIPTSIPILSLWFSVTNIDCIALTFYADFCSLILHSIKQLNIEHCYTVKFSKWGS